MNQPRNTSRMERAWEGLGGPIRTNGIASNSGMIDPTLDACCRREMEDRQKANTIRRTLQKHDRIAAQERARRNVLKLDTFDGCRCCYDPTLDGEQAMNEYRALQQLREELTLQTVETDHQTDPEGREQVNGTTDSDDDEEEDEFDYLLDELDATEGVVSSYEEARRTELEDQLFVLERAQQHGYGVHRPLHPSRVLLAAGLATDNGTNRRREPPPAVVLHLVDPESMASASLDIALEQVLCPRARGTIFLRSAGRTTLERNADMVQKVLPKVNPKTDLPLLVAIRDGIVVATCPGLQGLVNPSTGRVMTSEVEAWLERTGVMLVEPPLVETVCHIRPEEEALLDSLAPQASKQDRDIVFQCGVEGCQKSYHHEHVGVQNEHQSGLVLSEEVVLGKDKDQ